MTKKYTKAAINTLITGAFASVLALSPADVSAKDADTEKCYGVAKAGKNDCHDSKGTHSCATSSKIDGDGTEWISLPKGICEKLVGGSLEPYEAVEGEGEVEAAQTDVEAKAEDMMEEAKDALHDAKEHVKEEIHEHHDGMTDHHH